MTEQVFQNTSACFHSLYSFKETVLLDALNIFFRMLSCHSFNVTEHWLICDKKSNSLEIFKDEPNSFSLSGQLLSWWGSGGQPAPWCQCQEGCVGKGWQKAPNQVPSDELKWNIVNRMGQREERHTVSATATKPAKSGTYNCRIHNHLEANI